MYILGLTGPIASGKSAVAKMMTHEGCAILNADEIVHELYKSGTEENAFVQTLVGENITHENGDIDRNKLLVHIKKSPELLKKLENYIHPQVRKAYKTKLQELETSVDIAVIEAPLMFEGGLNTLCDTIAVCSCALNQRQQRALKREHMSQEKFEMIARKQMNISAYEEKADHIINTGISLLETEHEVIELITGLRGSFSNAWPTKWKNI